MSGDSVDPFDNVEKYFCSGTTNGQSGTFRDFRRERRDSKSLTLDRLLQNALLLRRFMMFCVEKKCGNKLLFWYECEAFQNLEWKPIKVLGVLETREALERRKNMTHEEFMAWEKQQNSMLKEYARAHGISQVDARLHKYANRVYKLYVKEGSAEEVKLPDEIVEDIEEHIVCGTGRVHLGVFRKAQKIIFQDMASNTFPYFLKSLSKADLKHMKQELKSAGRHDKPAMATAMAFAGKRSPKSFINSQLGAKNFLKENGRRPSIHIEPIVPDGAWQDEKRSRGPWLCFLKNKS